MDFSLVELTFNDTEKSVVFLDNPGVNLQGVWDQYKDLPPDQRARQIADDVEDGIRASLTVMCEAAYRMLRAKFMGVELLSVHRGSDVLVNATGEPVPDGMLPDDLGDPT